MVSYLENLRDDELETFRQPYNLRRARPKTLRERVRDLVYGRRKYWPWE